MRIPVAVIVLATLVATLLLVRADGARAGGLTLNVDRMDDPDPVASACTSAANDCSLRGAISSANASPGEDTIVLGPGAYPLQIAGAEEDENQTGDLDVLDDLVIVGAGPSGTDLDGAGLDRVLDIEPSNNADVSVSISDVGISDGVASDLLNGDGGGIRKAGNGLLELENVAIAFNEAARDGGGMHLVGGNLVAVDVVIRDNGSADDGGGLLLTSSVHGVFERAVIEDNSSASDGGGVFNVSNSTFANSTIRDNSASGNGGGIFDNGGTLTIDRSTVSGNTARRGGGMYIVRMLTLNNSTVSGNTASEDGGGILTFYFSEINPGTLNVMNSTITQNVADAESNSVGDGGGIFVSPQAIATLSDSILADNDAIADRECSGFVTSAGYNLFGNMAGCTVSGDTTGNVTGADPMLGQLQDNGGETMTHSLLAGSPAIDAASPACPPPGVDQRGFLRPAGAACDIGAFESGAVEGQTVIWGDNDCNGAITTRDNQALLRNILQQPPLSQTQPCPALGDVVSVGGASVLWGDLDCNGAIGARDGQALLRNVLGQPPLSQTQPCPSIGDTVAVVAALTLRRLW